MNSEIIEQLRWKKFPVLNDGHVCLVDVMGDDSAIVQAARVSYGEGTKHVSDDQTLIRYLMRHRHTTPFEMAEIKLRVRVPMDCWRQWIRHRTANVNEYSTRYSEAIDSRQTTPPNQWRLQSGTNKQGSSGFISKESEFPDALCDMTGNKPCFGDPADPEYNGGHISVGHFLTEQEQELHTVSQQIYEDRLRCGIAREQARKDLPLSTYTEAYWKCDLHNILHFLSLRMDSHAQWEIRQYATIIGEQIVKPLFPVVWEAFEDYRLNAVYLTALDVQVIRNYTAAVDCQIIQPGVPEKDAEVWPEAWRSLKSCRERDECIVKLQRLGIIK